jgi:hypothetical protein
VPLRFSEVSDIYCILHIAVSMSKRLARAAALEQERARLTESAEWRSDSEDEIPQIETMWVLLC